MNCIRCQNNEEKMVDERTQNLIDLDAVESPNEVCQSDQEDIGGFAGITGCLHKLKNSEKQVSRYFIFTY